MRLNKSIENTMGQKHNKWIRILPVFILLLVASQISYALDKAKVARWISPQGYSSEDTGDGSTDKENKKAVQPKSKVKVGMPAISGKYLKKKKAAEEKLVVSYIEPEDQSFADLAAVLEESRGIDEIVEAVNETYAFPHIDVVFDMCGQENAFYDSENRRIILCYELVAGLAHGFSQDSNLGDDEVGEQVIASLIFTFFHELGHAAVDVFNLPITGNEEDAVDRFATLLLLGDSDIENSEDLDLADKAIGSFDLQTAESLEDLDFADEHLVNEQRWFTMACLMVGSNPDKYEYLTGENGLPVERAQSCPAEYEKISKSWNSLLEEHLKES